MLCLFLPFWRAQILRELLLRYQDKESAPPAALRLRGAGGSAPRLAARVSGLSLAAMAPARRARVRARAAEGQSPEQCPLYNQGRAARPRPDTGPGGLAPPRWGQRQAARRAPARCPTGLVRRARDRAPAAGQCKGGIAAAPTARLALALLRRLCQRQPRAQADRPPPKVARAGSAASRQQALRGVASGLRGARPASRGTFWQRGAAATWARRGAP